MALTEEEEREEQERKRREEVNPSGYGEGFGSIHPQAVADIRKAMYSPEFQERYTPLQRLGMQYAFDPSRYPGYTNDPKSQESRSKFARDFDRYYNPFLIGWGSAKQEDIPDYKKSLKMMRPGMSPETQRERWRYNKSLMSTSRADSAVNKIAKGIGTVMGASGGPGGLIGGTLLAEGAPVLWDIIKRWRAKKYSKSGQQHTRKQLKGMFRDL